MALVSQSEPINKYLDQAGNFNEHLITYKGSMIGGISLSGVDPASVDNDTLMIISSVITNILNLFDTNVILSSYYIHYENEVIKLRKYSDERVNVLVSRREKFLNQKRKLNGSKLYWVIEYLPSENLNKIKSITFLRNLFGSLFDTESRKRVKVALSFNSSYVFEINALNRLIERLNALLDEINLKLTFISFDNQKLKLDEVWCLNRFLVNLNIDYLKDRKKNAPVAAWDRLLADGSVRPVTVKGYDLLKITGAKTIYAKIAHISQFGDENLNYGIWSRMDNCPVLLDGNYIYFTRFRRLSNLQRTLLFKNKKDIVTRGQISLTSMLKNVDVESQISKKIEFNPEIKSRLEEIEKHKSNDQGYCYFCSSIVLFDENPFNVIENINKFNRTLTNHMHLIWEDAGLASAYRRFQIANSNTSYRDMELDLNQAGACSLIYRSTTGVEKWGLENRESAYVFESLDKTPFHFSPYVNEKMFAIGVGPTRSGKSFLRIVLASHYRKYDGIYVAIDIDAGSETLVQAFGDDAALFKLSNDPTTNSGLNPLIMAVDANDKDWIAHFSGLVRDLLKTNPSIEMQSFTKDEQLSFDSAVIKALSNRDNPVSITETSLSTVAAYAGKEVAIKLKRFLRGGMYGHIFDNQNDAIGVIDKPISVYNLAAIKDDLDIVGLVQREILFRVTRLFESPKYQNKFKHLDMDECKTTFDDIDTTKFFEKKIRTWFKHHGGASIWTQSPSHYFDMPGWETLKASASTFFFLSDPDANSTAKESYKKTFGLSDALCNVISNLTPKRQMLIVQRDIDVVKAVNLIVEPEQYIVSTSKAEEVVIRNDIFNHKEMSFDEAIQESIRAINRLRDKNDQL